MDSSLNKHSCIRQDGNVKRHNSDQEHMRYLAIRAMKVYTPLNTFVNIVVYLAHAVLL
jgi:hypothetical protein